MHWILLGRCINVYTLIKNQVESRGVEKDKTGVGINGVLQASKKHTGHYQTFNRHKFKNVECTSRVKKYFQTVGKFQFIKLFPCRSI